MTLLAYLRCTFATLGLSAALQPPCLAATQTLVFTVLEAAPYGERDGAGQVRGIYPDILRALSAQMQVPIKIELVPFARAAQLVAVQDAGATLMFQNSLIENKAVPLVAVFSTELVVQLRPGLHDVPPARFASLKIGRIRGGCKNLEQDGARFYELNSQEQGVKMLMSRRIDGFCTDAHALRAAQAHYDPDGLLNFRNRVLVARRDVWLFAGRHVGPAMEKQLRDGMVALQENGTIDRILALPRGAGAVP